MLKVAWDTRYVLPLPAGHRFPMEKYELLPKQLLYEGTLTNKNFFSPSPCEDRDILAVHSDEYFKQLKELTLSKSDIRKSGFPLSQELIEREVLIAGGTVQCTEYALKYGISMNIAGGTHHAFKDAPEGFCLLNDQAIAAQRLLRLGKVSRILIVDLDVHQGNGTAKLFSETSDIFTFSMHGEKNYPLHKELSDVDVELPDDTGDDMYLNTLYTKLLDIAAVFHPDFVFYQAGVDVLKTDKLGRLSLSNTGCAHRDEMVFDFFRSRDLPVVVCMGGGYSPRIKDILDAHANTFRIAARYFD